MRKLLWRLFLVAVLFAALVPSLAIVSQSIVPLLITLVFGALFLLLELPPTKTSISTLQYLTVRVLLTVILFVVGILFIQSGLSEFSTPYIPSRPLFRIFLEAVRSLFGHTPVAILLVAFGGVCVILGFNYLRTGKVAFSSKTISRVEGE
jgi:hypothetical protein